MDRLADDYAARGAGSVFLYTNEAHPGEEVGPLRSFEQKVEHARKLRDEIGIRRPILLDKLEGDLHLAYGSMPNMAWIFDEEARPVYKADWTDADSLRNALDFFLEVGRRAKEGTPFAAFHVERLDYRVRDPKNFMKQLARNGPRAVTEFRAAFGPQWGGSEKK